jgi:AraC family transcriptional regulator
VATTYETRKDHHRRVQQVMIDIDRHLDHPWDLEAMAAVACLSPYHFHRVFQQCTGESPRQHLHRRRMEQAARCLCTTSARITDIALDVGYDSPNAFCKAFRKWSGRPPRRFRRRPVSMEGYASFRLGFPRPPRRPPDWRPEITMLPTRRMLFIEKRGFQDGSFYQVGQAAALELRDHLLAAGVLQHVRAWLSTFPRRPQGITDTRVAIQVGVVLDRPMAVTAPLQTRRFGGGRWAIFCHRGPYHFLFQSWNRAYFGALPALGLTPRDADPFEHYVDAGSDRPEAVLRTRIHVPIF